MSALQKTLDGSIITNDNDRVDHSFVCNVCIKCGYQWAKRGKATSPVCPNCWTPYWLNSKIDMKKVSTKIQKTHSVYFMKSQNNLLKIGRSIAMEGRKKSYSTHNPGTQLIGYLKDANEKEIQSRFIKYIVEGETEWFHPCKEIINFINDSMTEIDRQILEELTSGCKQKDNKLM